MTLSIAQPLNNIINSAIHMRIFPMGAHKGYQRVKPTQNYGCMIAGEIEKLMDRGSSEPI